MPPRKKRLSNQVRQLVARRVGRLVADSNPAPKKRTLYVQRSDHWQETPRCSGKFASDRPTSKKAINFKIPEDLMEELEAIASTRGTSIHLVVKQFVVDNFDQLTKS